ncbi:ROK family transcriptional regulator [Lentzea aerocolonigenes]|uniref:ROK family transcriptional regulator n=1 Tax=Lentzea aerocolonigenes TaxID=68170 RepID=UPI0007C4C7DC|nr:ROK family transcriptional regulator [Lentzea aerocolonigenes]MCP2243934.1 Sugar kinase of the NBD/HSP70 family, may containing an N-terminal HTH domain [Lentzea aerocolonigenes]
MPRPVPAVRTTPDPPVNLRSLGRVRVLEALIETRRLSRPDLVRRTGLARATVGSVIADLIRAGVVTDGDANREDGLRTGRPARTLSLNRHAAYALGVDIGRDHVRVVLCDLFGEPVWDRDLHRLVDNDSGEVLTEAAELIAEARRVTGIPAERILGVGMGIACPIDRHGTLLAEGIMPGWIGVRPTDELRERTGFAVRLLNDANAAVLAEHRHGVAQHCGDVVYIRLSTGIGAGIISDGRLLLGAGGLAGELGHVIVEPSGAICRCGNRGCLETVASPAAIAKLLSAEPTSTAELIDLVRAGDRGAIRAMEDAGDAVGRALAQAVTIVNPDLVVIGGELAAAGDVLVAPIHRAVQRNAMSWHTSDLRVVPGALGDSAGVRGAAALVLADAPERLAALVAG